MSKYIKEREVSKNEFKKLYFKYGNGGGWTKNHWDHFYEDKDDQKYYFTEPTGPDQNRMFIISDNDKHRMILMTEDAEETFFLDEPKNSLVFHREFLNA